MGIPFFWVTIVSLVFTIDRKDRFSIPGSDEVRLLESWRCTGLGTVKFCSDSAWVCLEHFNLCCRHTFTGPFFLEENYAITFPIPCWCWTAHRVTQAHFYQRTLTQLAQLEWPSHRMHCPLGYWGNFGPHHKMWAPPAATVSWQLLGHGRYLVNAYPELGRDSQQWIKDDHVHQWPLSGWQWKIQPITNMFPLFRCMVPH